MHKLKTRIAIKETHTKGREHQIILAKAEEVIKIKRVAIMEIRPILQIMQNEQPLYK